MTDTTGLLALLQLADSQFPAGTFAHSYGLEQLARDGRVRDALTLEAFVRSVTHSQSASSDARAATAVARAADSDSLAEVCAIDAALFRTKGAEELRTASTATGTRLLHEVAIHESGQSGLILEYFEAVRSGRTPGTHPVAFAVAGAALGVDAEAIVSALLLGTASVILSASMRLLPVSHRDVQATLHRLRPEIALLAREAVEDAAAPFASFHPLQEIAAMRHRAARVRLFAS